jgi:hypothetical protein
MTGRTLQWFRVIGMMAAPLIVAGCVATAENADVGETISALETGTLQSKQLLLAGQTLLSEDGSHRLCFQEDGNVVIYNAQNRATWATNTVNNGAFSSTRLVMQGDGNLVLYGTELVTSPSWKPPLPPTVRTVARWNSSTGNRPGAELVMQNDGNLVIYQSYIAVWNSRTNGL